MKRIPLIILITLVGFSAFSMELNNAYILEHKSEVTGKDKQGRAISGRLDNGSVIYRTKPNIKNKSRMTSTNGLSSDVQEGE